MLAGLLRQAFAPRRSRWNFQTNEIIWTVLTERSRTRPARMRVSLVVIRNAFTTEDEVSGKKSSKHFPRGAIGRATLDQQSSALHVGATRDVS